MQKKVISVKTMLNALESTYFDEHNFDEYIFPLLPKQISVDYTNILVIPGVHRHL